MATSYTVRYLKTYVWKAIALILNLLSLFIVVPKLSSLPIVFGIYSVIISSVIFLSYADLGFVSAGNKFAAEAFIRGEIEEETRLEGFSAFILVMFILLFTGLYFYISYNPALLIKNVESGAQLDIAKKLLIIQGFFCITTVLQRLNDTIFGIRIEEYLFRQIQICGALIKIGSVFFFFSDLNKYDIVGYFLCTKIVDLVICFIGLWIAKIRFRYPFHLVVHNIRFSMEIFKKTKAIAFASFLETLLWICFYELDGIFISKTFGSQKLAIYTIALTLATYYRNLSSLIFAPFQQRFNHFMGLRDMEGLKSFYLKVVQITMPVIVMSTLSFALFAKPFINCWVGKGYSDSIAPAILLVLGNVFLFFHIPGANLVLALSRVKQLIFINVLTAIVFWTGVLATVKYLDILSLAVFKFVCFIMAALFYLSLGKNFIEFSYIKFFKKTIFQIIVPVAVLVVLSVLITPFLPDSKSAGNLLIVISAAVLLNIIFFIVLLLVSPQLKKSYAEILQQTSLIAWKKKLFPAK